MTMQVVAATWREAFDAAEKELRSGGYAGWGRARVFKCSPALCWHDECPRDWVADIA